MKKLMIILFLAAFLSLPGCGVKPAGYVAPSRIVSSVDIRCQRASGTIRRHYEKPEKIEAVLHYLRMLEPNGPMPLSEEALHSDLYEITVHLQDGGTRTHRQRGDSFATLHRRYWGRIDRSVGLRLGHILTLLPSDKLDANYTDMPKKAITTG